jgi:hypothetical protein
MFFFKYQDIPKQQLISMAQKQIIKRIPYKMVRRIGLIMIDPYMLLKWLGINHHLLKFITIIFMFI